ncbi:sialin-like [Phymastichus coffea]|uniref:sialin-like n=1 Tax=Phymastichus coffea TaxID=108790 RepID=UPI00273CDBE6|nr:sialin-like [Phymastichus coffea]
MSTLLKSCCAGVSQKWIFTILATIGVCIGNILRVIISITLVEMATPISEHVKQEDDTCVVLNHSYTQNITHTIHSSDESIHQHRYDWDEYTQGIILSAFFWGYALTQWFYGALVERFGGKYLLGTSVFVPAVITFLTPALIAWGGANALIVSRVLIGVANGSKFPAASTMISKWTTPAERTQIANAIYAGPLLGLFIGTIIPGLIMKYSGMGWPAVYYLFGGIGIIWFPAWVLLAYNSPADHPFITKEELDSLQPRNEIQRKLPPAPWRHMLMCKGFWTFTISLIGNSWAYYAMIADLPKYMSSVVKLPIDSNGFFSALPYLFTWFISMLSSWVNDKILKKKWMSVTNVRKLLATISLTGPAVFIMLASFAECDTTMVISMFLIGITLMGCLYPSVMMSPLDLSPNYAGSVMAIGNSISSIVGIITPYTIGVLTPNQTIGEWRLVFWIVFFFSVSSNVIYLLWFSAEVKDWDDSNFIRNKTNTKKNINGAEMKVVP